ncbi:MAG: Na+/H+ antiporter subunit D [Actinomycetaceae bacterium]|nr:Na+/H+ antiporter subunit D [Actinomycetaceae bacterium]
MMTLIGAWTPLTPFGLPPALWLLPAPVLIPLISAGLAILAAKYPRIQASIAIVALSLSLIASAGIIVVVDRNPMVLDVGSWAAPVGVSLVADRLSAAMLFMALIVTFAVHIYSVAQGSSSDNDVSGSLPLPIFQPTFLILSAGVSYSFLTGDLFNLYVGFEILLMASFVLITLGGTRGRIRSGTVYVVVSLVGSFIFLLGIAATYGATGTVNMAQLTTRLREIDPGVALILQALLLVGFALKAAVFPLSAWLPDSYPAAPAPVTAVFAGLLTKVGIYAIIRVQVLLFPPSPADKVLGFLGILTMIIGIVGAVAQDDLKRLLSFTLVSHIGFMLWGISLYSTVGIAAAVLYALHHILVQTTLFLVSGLIEHLGGSTSLTKLHSLVRLSPLLGALYLIPALNLVGFPPLTGFIGKYALSYASVINASPLGWALLAAGLVTSLLTLYVVIKVWNMAFWQTQDEAEATISEEDMEQCRSRKCSWRFRVMAGATGTLIAVSLVMTAFGEVVYSYTYRLGYDQMLRETYVTAVIPTKGRGRGKSKDVKETREEQRRSSTELGIVSDSQVDSSGTGFLEDSSTDAGVDKPRRSQKLGG